MTTSRFVTYYMVPLPLQLLSSKHERSYCIPNPVHCTTVRRYMYSPAGKQSRPSKRLIITWAPPFEQGPCPFCLAIASATGRSVCMSAATAQQLQLPLLLDWYDDDMMFYTKRQRNSAGMAITSKGAEGHDWQQVYKRLPTCRFRRRSAFCCVIILGHHCRHTYGMTPSRHNGLDSLRKGVGKIITR